MNKFQWCDDYCLNIEVVDAPQQQMLKLMNQLNEMRENDSDVRSIAEALTEMTEFARNFFRSEERMLNRFNYPEYQEHRKEHRDFIKNIIMFRRWFAEDAAKLTDDVFEFFRVWVSHHILVSDQRYAPFIRLQMYLEECKAAGNKCAV